MAFNISGFIRKKLDDFQDNVFNNAAKKIAPYGAWEAIGRTPVGTALWNSQEFLEGNKPIEIPNIQTPLGGVKIGTIPIANKPVTLGNVANFGREIVNYPLRYGAGTVADLGTNLGMVGREALGGRGADYKSYDQLKSPVTRLGYQVGGLFNNQNAQGLDVNFSPQHWLGNIGGTIEGPLSVYGGGKALGALKGGQPLLQQGMKQAIIRGAGQGGAIGGAFGITSGLSEGRDETLVNQLAKAGQYGALGAVFGGVLGGATGAGSNVLSKYKLLTKRDAKVDAELKTKVGSQPRDSMTGQYMEKGLKKPKGMPLGQWEAQLRFNKKYGRDPYEPVYYSDVDRAIRYELEKKSPGLTTRDINKDINPLGTTNPAQTGQLRGQGALSKTGKGVDNTSGKTPYGSSIADDANAQKGVDMKYFAGILDGEGHIRLTPAKNGQGRSYMRPDVIVVQKNREMLDELQKTFGGRVSKSIKPNWNNTGTRELYRWELNGRKAVELAKQVEPYLIEKAGQVKRISGLQYDKSGRMVKSSIPNIDELQPIRSRAQQPKVDAKIPTQQVAGGQIKTLTGQPQARLNNAVSGGDSQFARIQQPKQTQYPSQAQTGLKKPQLSSQKQELAQGGSYDDIIAQERAKITSGKPKLDTRSLGQVGNDIYTSWVDRFYPITKLSQGVGKTLKAKGAELRPEYDPSYLVKRFLGAGGIAENRYNNQLKPIINKIDNLKIDKTDLDTYLVARRNVGFGKVGREVYGSDPKTSQKVVNGLEAKYGENIKGLADQLYDFENKLFDDLVEAGFINKNKAKIIKQQNPDYVPFFRDVDSQLDEYLGIPSNVLQQPTNPINKLKGSDKDILSPIESIIANNFKFTAAIEKNRVAKSIYNLNKVDDGLGFKVVDKSGPGTISVWENGQKKFVDVGEEVARAVKGMNEESMNSILKLLTVPASILRQSATGRNPAFMIPNTIRDQFEAAILSRYGYTPFVDYARGFAHLLKKDEVYQQWQKSGAQIALSELSGRKNVAQLFDKTAGKKKLFSWITDSLDLVGKYSEQPTRIQLYANAMKKTGNPLMAAKDSREATVDFARMGAKMKVANSLIPFLNVGVQAFDRMIRMAKGNPKQLALKLGIFAALPQATTTAYNLTYFPEEYKEIPTWEKDTNFIIVNGRNEDGTVDYFKIPKAHIVRYVANPLENFMEYTAGTNQETFKQMAYQFISSGLPVVGSGSSAKEIGVKTVGENLPQFIKPTTENLLNKSFFKYSEKDNEPREIVPYYIKDKAPGDQSYEWTPGAYKVIGKTIGISPLKVQNFLEGHFSGYVKGPLEIIDTMKAIADGEQVDKNRMFILRRFMGTTFPQSSGSSGSSSDAKKGKIKVVSSGSGVVPKAEASDGQEYTESEVRDRVESSGESVVHNGIAYYREDGEVKSLKTKRQVKLGELTGIEEIDKRIVKNYKSAVSRRQNEIVKLYQNGFITKEHAQREIERLENVKDSLLGKAGYGEKSKLKVKKTTVPKVKAPSTKLNLKNATSGAKLQDIRIKSSGAKTLQVKKPKKLNLKALRGY